MCVWFHPPGECLSDFTRAFPWTLLGDFHHKTSYPGPTTLQKLTTSPDSAHFYPLVTWVTELPFNIEFNTKTGHVRDVLPSESLVLVLKKLNTTKPGWLLTCKKEVLRDHKHPRSRFITCWFTELSFYISTDTKEVISETFSRANLLACMTSGLETDRAYSAFGNS